VAKRAFTVLERRAIWEAHERRSAYTGDPVDFADLHIDHVIPERTLHDGTLPGLLARLDLPVDFDVNGYENLLPARPFENLRKGGEELDEGSTRFFLGMARGKKSRVEELAARYRRDGARARVLMALETAGKQGEVSRDDVIRVLDEIGDPDRAFALLTSLKLGGGDTVERIRATDLDGLRHIPLLSADQADGGRLRLVNDTDEEVYVQSVHEYEHALAEGFFAFNTYEIKTSVVFEHASHLLSALSDAIEPRHRFISEGTKGIHSLELLPIAAVAALEFGESGLLKGRKAAGYLDAERLEDGAYALPADYHTTSVEQLVAEHVLQIAGCGTNHLRLEWGGMGILMWEVVRGDFDGDGYEDLLVSHYVYATEGTLGYGGSVILTRKSMTDLFAAQIPEQFRNH